tara:strand:+ start:2762 stop:3133 length:372 start_codon:yes stop_codon:yes gene_type:complete
MIKKLKVLIIYFIFNIGVLDASEKIDQNEIFKNLRCLVCQGQSVADSNSEFAQTLKIVVNDLVTEGKSKKEIYSFLIDKYGEWIVYKPRFNFTNFLLWTLPYLVLVMGGLIILILVKKKRRNY